MLTGLWRQSPAVMKWPNVEPSSTDDRSHPQGNGFPNPGAPCG